MRGEVVEKTQWADEAPFALFLRAMFGCDLVVNVKKAVSIGRNGYRGDQDLLEDKKKVRSSRHMNRQLELNQEVFLVCNSTGRAIATLSDLHDDAVAEELRAAVLDIAPAPEPASAPEPATEPERANAAPEPESLQSDGQREG